MLVKTKEKDQKIQYIKKNRFSMVSGFPILAGKQDCELLKEE
jgi:hypothetical protein